MFGRDSKKRQASRLQTRGRSLRINPRPLAGLVMFGMVAWALVWGGERVLEPDFLPLRSAEVEGEFVNVTAAEIRALMKPFAEQGFVHVDTEEVRRRIEALPWIKSATVFRQWPDSLRIRIREQQAVARWRSGGLVNPQGELFLPPPVTYPQELPLFAGPARMQKVMLQRYWQMQRILAPLNFSVTRLELDVRGAWRLGLDSGLVLVLGRQEKSHERLQRFVRTYNGALAARAEQIEQVDLRYTNGFAVRWKPVGDVSKEMNNV